MCTFVIEKRIEVLSVPVLGSDATPSGKPSFPGRYFRVFQLMLAPLVTHYSSAMEVKVDTQRSTCRAVYYGSELGLPR